MKFTKFSTTEVPSFLGAIDIVFYKDENNGLYRLRYVDPVFRDPSPIMSLHRTMCVSKYAPEIIEGEAIRENSDEVHVKIENEITSFKKMQRN